MKKKILSLLFLIVIAFTCVICVNASTVYATSEKSEALNLDEMSGQTNISVGDDYEFIFMPYVTSYDDFTYTISDESVVYVNPNLNKYIGLKAGTATITVENANFYSEIEITVKLEDLNPDPGFDQMAAGTTWTTSNETNYGWRLYTGGTEVKSDQIVEVYTEYDEEGNPNNMIHYNHTSEAYSNLYTDLTDLPAGQYYVTVDMKTNNVTKTYCYVRLNLNGSYGSTQTQSITGSYDWATYTSNTFRLADGEDLRLELYFANNSGEVFFDNLHVYRIITLDHTAFMVGNSVEKLEIGETAQINCETVPASTVDYEYTYVSSNPEVATVSKTGLITAVSTGISYITVTDVLEGFTRTVMVLVGEEGVLTATANAGETVIVLEDEQATIPITSADSSDFIVATYTSASYGDYYISGQNVIYTPDADYYTLGDTTDSFDVVVYDEALGGFTTVTINVQILPQDDEVKITDYWLSVEKNGKLEWTVNGTGQTYDHTLSDYGLKGGGYLQISTYDVEVLYPATTLTNMGSTSTEQAAYRAAKTALYQNTVSASALDGSYTITTANGGTVEILYDGLPQEIQDRYYSSQNKLIYGIVYEYTAPTDFVGYDTFEIVVRSGDIETTFTCTVYVLPDTDDFNFDNLDYDGVYLLSNDEWIEEVRAGYEAGDEYITTWLEYYEAQYAIFVPTGDPASARSYLEQLAILYQVTQNYTYFEMCWEQMEMIVKDEEYSGDGTARLSWGEDSNGFLDAAMVTYSVAFAYNYIKDELTEAQKQIVLKALYEEGFYYFENLNNVNVLLHGNNHNLLICGNLAVAAFSVMSYDGTISGTINGVEYTVDIREMAASTVITAFRYLQIGLVHYSSSGGFPEGPSYSIYAHRNMVNLLSTMYNLYGMDDDGYINSFGIGTIDGIVNYINYPLYTSTPNYETFYYTESTYSNNQPALLWYTRISEDNINAAILPYLAHQNEQYNIQNLLWYQPGLFDKIDLHEIEETDYLLEDHEIATFRSEFGDEMGLFVGLKGVDDNTNNFSHKNLDSGTFEIYALGERFIGNYTDEDYSTSVPDGFWDYDYQRWTYYKKNAQGSNTLVINPDQNPVLTQDPYESAPITRFESNDNSGIAVVDLSRVYKSEAISVQRGLRVFNNKNYVMIQDEFKLREPSTLYWSAHTEARVDLLSDKLARLTLNNKVLYALIVSEAGTFYTMSGNDALPGTIGNFGNYDNDGITKLVIELNEVVEDTLCVVFIPSLEEIVEFDDYEVIPIDEWTLDSDEALPDIIAEDITFDLDFTSDLGEGYTYKFYSYQYTYLVQLGKGATEVPDFIVTYDETKYDLTISKSNLLNNISTVTLTDKETGESRTYKFKFVADVMNSTTQYSSYEVVEVSSVSGHDDANLLIDGSNSTGISETTRQEIIFKFDGEVDITDVLIRFNGGVINTYYFDIWYSLDGENWSSCYFAGQNSNNIGDEVHALGHLSAEYIKIVFYGNDNDDSINVTEVRFFNNGTVPTSSITSTTSNNTWIWIVVGVVGLLVIGGVVTTIIVLKRRSKKDE